MFSGGNARAYSYTTFDDNRLAMFEENGTYVVIAVVLAFALLGVVAVQTVMVSQQAEAASITGQCASAIRNASSSLCPKGP